MPDMVDQDIPVQIADEDVLGLEDRVELRNMSLREPVLYEGLETLKLRYVIQLRPPNARLIAPQSVAATRKAIRRN